MQDDWEFISPKYWEFLGYDPETKRHHPSEWQALIDPEDAKRWGDEYRKHIESRGENPPVVSGIVRYRRANGENAYVVCQGKVIEWDFEGNPVRMIGTHTDVTEATLAKAKIEEQADLIQKAFEASMHPCCIISLEGYFTKVNPAFVQLFGYAKEELSHLTWQEITHKDDLASNIEILNGLLSGEIEKVEIEKRFVRKDGSVMPTRVHCEILKPKIGPPYFLMHVKDLTLEKELLREFRKFDSIGNGASAE